MRPSRALLGVDAICVLVLAWIYGSDVADVVRAHSAAVSALTELPRLWFAVPVLLLTLGVAAAVVVGLKQRRNRSYRGYRMPPILVAVVLFVDVLVLGAQRIPLSSADQSAISLHVAARLLTELVGPDGVPTDVTAIASVVRGMGPPPFLVHGRRPEHFAVQVRTGCAEPVGEAPGVEAGTLIYCASADRQYAWITLVGLAAEKRFGDPELFTRDGLVQTTVVEKRAPAAEDAPPPAGQER